ncbi:MAG: hypothetical protein HYV09_35810 [Deltaproteobacteria bacterium]|nr:hypothetical protein [Deltaproteobacteria bacterium]
MHTDNVTREKQINIRLSEEEAARLDFLTNHHGINPSALLRMLMKREEDRVRRELRALEERRERASSPTADEIVERLKNEWKDLGALGVPKVTTAKAKKSTKK